MGTQNANSGDPYQVGKDITFKVNGQEFAITNLSYTKDVNTNEVQLNDSLAPRIAITGLRFSGSFEHDGHNNELQQAIEHTADSGHIESMEPIRGTITVEEGEGFEQNASLRVTTFEGVVVNSRSKDMPADDSSSVTYDFMAEAMVVG